MKRLLPSVTLAFAAASAIAEDSQLTLACKLTNPFSDVVNVPINQNPDFGIGADHGWRYTLTVQPVIPFAINREWNIISRSVVPFISQHSDGRSDTGLGDIAQSFFLSPKHATEEGWFWGAGPIFLLPTATEDRFGADHWGTGPTAGLLKRSGPWTVGALMNHTWSLSGHAGREDLNATFLQPFIDFTTDSKTTFSLNTESTHDWTQNQWTVPLNLVVRHLFKSGNHQVSLAVGARYYAEGPEGGPKWGARLGVTLVFPK